MSLEKIVVDEFEILKNGDEYAIAFQLDDGMVFDADFMYDGRNCAILTRNNKKAFLLTQINPDVRKILNKIDSVVIIEKAGKEIANAYKIDVRHVENIPYPDTFEEDVNRMMEELRAELGEEEFNELIKNLAAEYKKSLSAAADK